jgi:hypothetical protein
VLSVPKGTPRIQLNTGEYPECVETTPRVFGPVTLNKVAIKNSYPLPRVDDIFDQLTSSKFFFKIDIRSGYNQIRLDKDAIPKTAFRTRYGLFEFTVLPFGLSNAPSTFMAFMNDVFHTHLDSFVIIYLDDILIYIHTIDDHLLHCARFWNYFDIISRTQRCLNVRFASRQLNISDTCYRTSVSPWNRPVLMQSKPAGSTV